jgi:hypothetical protein
VRCEEGIDKSRVCFSRKEDLYTEHFIELLGRRVGDYEAWERTLRSQSNLKEAEMIRRDKDQMLRGLKRLNDIKSRANK